MGANALWGLGIPASAIFKRQRHRLRPAEGLRREQHGRYQPYADPS